MLRCEGTRRWWRREKGRYRSRYGRRGGGRRSGTKARPSGQPGRGSRRGNRYGGVDQICRFHSGSKKSRRDHVSGRSWSRPEIGQAAGCCRRGAQVTPGVQGPIPPGGGGVVPLIVEAGGGQEAAHLYTCKYLEQKNSIIYKVRDVYSLKNHQ